MRFRVIVSNVFLVVFSEMVQVGLGVLDRSFSEILYIGGLAVFLSFSVCCFGQSCGLRVRIWQLRFREISVRILFIFFIVFKGELFSGWFQCFWDCGLEGERLLRFVGDGGSWWILDFFVCAVSFLGVCVCLKLWWFCIFICFFGVKLGGRLGFGQVQQQEGYRIGIRVVSFFGFRFFCSVFRMIIERCVCFQYRVIFQFFGRTVFQVFFQLSGIGVFGGQQKWLERLGRQQRQLVVRVDGRLVLGFCFVGFCLRQQEVVWRMVLGGWQVVFLVCFLGVLLVVCSCLYFCVGCVYLEMFDLIECCFILQK